MDPEFVRMIGHIVLILGSLAPLAGIVYLIILAIR